MGLFSSDDELDTDYTDRCGHCHAELDPEDKFCPYCGTKRGEGEFKPFENRIEVLYGPPIDYKVTCKDCGNEWKTFEIGFSKIAYCPQCGSSSIDVQECPWD